MTDSLLIVSALKSDKLSRSIGRSESRRGLSQSSRFLNLSLSCLPSNIVNVSNRAYLKMR